MPGIGTAIAKAIPEDASYSEVSEAVARLVVGMFLSTNFHDDDRLQRFDKFCVDVRAELVREIAAGKAIS